MEGKTEEAVAATEEADPAAEDAPRRRRRTA